MSASSGYRESTQRRIATALPRSPYPSRMEEVPVTQRHQSAAVEPQDGPTVRLDERRHKLAELIAAKLEQGCWVEFQRDTDAVLVSRGPRRWLGRVGPREENRREA